MRAFLAINLNDSLKEGLALLQQHLEEKVGGVRWLKPEQLHITLKFLGEIDTGQIYSFAPLLAELGKTLSPFVIAFSGLGCFPNTRYPRVVWIGAEKGAEQLTLLSAAVEKVFSRVQSDIPGEKGRRKGKPKKMTGDNFVPHLTIGRRIKNETVSLEEGLMEKEWRCFNILQVDAFYLMQSTLRPSGAEYNILEKFSLQS